MKSYHMMMRRIRHARETMPPAGTALVWLVLMCLLASRRSGSDTSVGPLAASTPSEVPYVPSEDPEFGMEEEEEVELPKPSEMELGEALSKLLTPEELSNIQRPGGRVRGSREILSLSETAQAPKSDAETGTDSESTTDSTTKPPTTTKAPVTTTSTTPSTTTTPPSEDPASFSEEEKTVIGDVFDWVEHPTGFCKRQLTLGGRIEDDGTGCPRVGHRRVCLDPPMRVATSSECLVYSFSVLENDWSFDEAMAALDCEVHTFNPRLDIPEGQRSPGITFHRLGLGRDNYTDVNGWHMLRLDQIVRRLGHVGRPIHYLKTSADGGELEMLAQQVLDATGEFVLDMVEQLGLEVRLRTRPHKHMEFYRETAHSVAVLQKLGYQTVDSAKSPLSREMHTLPGVDHDVRLRHQVLLVKNAADTWDRGSRGQ